jgi:hypothetical protein
MGYVYPVILENAKSRSNDRWPTPGPLTRVAGTAGHFA